MISDNPILDFLDRKGILILDGGLATELEARGFDLDDDLWSAKLLLQDPHAIWQVHYDYLMAGADCVISSSYQGTIPGFKKRGLSQNEAENLLRLSVDLALDARNEFWAESSNREGRLRPIVAASIGPYGAYLADGSEYRGDYGLNEEQLYRFHLPRWRVLSETKADVLACETIPSAVEAAALARLIDESPQKPTWISFSCKDGYHLNDGTPVSKCVASLGYAENLIAVGINCTSPQYISTLVSEIKSVTDKPVLVYPNSGERYDPLHKRWEGVSSSTDFAMASLQWSAAGATLIGGCCRTGPEHIRLLRQTLLA